MKKYFITALLYLLINNQNAFASANPTFVIITSKFCVTCKELEPIVEELKSKYDGKITFIKLDVSSKDSLQEAKETAQKNGISEYYEKNKMTIPNVGLFCTGANSPEKSFLGETNKKLYEDALNELLTNTSKVCSR